MGTITSGVGLISGLDIQTIVSRLVAIDGRPRDQLVARIGGIDAQRTALKNLSALVSGILSRVTSMGTASSLSRTSAASSHEGILGVSSGAGATPGTYNFVVRSLASTHQLVSRGFTSSTTPLAPGELTIESAAARVNAPSRLDALRGATGIQRGAIRITDDSGKSAVVKLHDAIYLDEVLERINAAGVNVTATLQGDALVLTEGSGGKLVVEEVAGGRTAADLGFGPGKTLSLTGSLTGDALAFLAPSSPLASLNDGNGVRRAKAGGDFTINGMKVDLSELLTDATRIERLNHGNSANLGRIKLTTVDAAGASSSVEVDLTGLTKMGQVKEAIQNAIPELAITFAGNRMVIGYPEEQKVKKLTIEDVTGNGAAGLGISGSSETGKVNGRSVLFVDQAIDVVNAINYADDSDGAITATLDATRLRITSSSGSVTLAAVGTSHALRDLGFDEGALSGAAQGRRIVSGLNSTLLATLNGGKGFTSGVIGIDVGGSLVSVDLSGAETLRDVIERVNAAAKAARVDAMAEFEPNGTRIRIRALDGLTPVSVHDASGTFAADTGLDGAGGTPGATARSNNLQRRYLSENTRLDTLNHGQGVRRGALKITNSTGVSKTITLGTTVNTLGDVIDEINKAGMGVTARINDRGDGIVLEDTGNGELGLKVQEVGGTVARDLNLLGESTAGVLDGSFELRFTSTGSTTLADLVAQINARTALARASVLNDGTGVNPYRLSLIATAQGTAGELLLDDGGIGLDPTTLNRAQDARVLLGTNPESGVLLTSSSNTLDNVVPGLTLSLHSASDTPVTVTVNQDDENLITSVRALVDAFNAALNRVKDLTKFDPETETRGVLLGNSTARAVENRLFRLATMAFSGAPGGIQRLGQLGVTLKEGRLNLDETKLREAVAAGRSDVIAFFTAPETGVSAVLQAELKAMTDSDGLIPRNDQNLEDQRKLLSSRVDALNDLLSRKRERLLRQFNAMESTLALLQAQQGALSQLAALASATQAQRN